MKRLIAALAFATLGVTSREQAFYDSFELMYRLVTGFSRKVVP